MKRRTTSESSDLPTPWDDEYITRSAWEKHKDYLMSFDVGSRNDGWWLYERNMEPPGPPYMQARILYQMGELKGGELETVMGWWRDHYDRAQDRDDQAARRWHLKTRPPSLIKKWDAERKRNGK
jgi:hypothetical protein